MVRVRGRYLLFISALLFQCTNKTDLPAGDPGNGGLLLPDGFEALVVADSTGKARHLAVNTNGDIYIKLVSSEKGKSIVALRDTTGDGKADIQVNFGGRDTARTYYGTGMTIHNDYLYYSSATEVFRNKLSGEKLIPESEAEVVFTDDHEHGIHWHITKPVAFDNKGHMFIPFGAPSNACQDIGATPNGAPGGKGLDPCPELDEHGGIWRFDAGKTGLKQKDGIRYATGIRSVVAMDWNNDDEQLYLVMHGRDNLYSLFPNLFTPWQSALLPAEEFLRVREGAHFGWPYCYYDQLQQRKVLAPEYGGDGQIAGRCENADAPLMGFPGHWAPNDLLFYHGDQFPVRYKQGAFIAFHGSTNRAPYSQSGYIVCFIPFVNGEPTGKWEVFADGFSGADTLVNTRDALYRPVGLATGPDGSLYISDSNKGKIWRILYKGDRGTFGEAQLETMEHRKNAMHIRTPDEVKDNLQLNIPADQKLYNTFCGTCHQQNGKGAAGRFPTLAGTEWVTGDKSRLIGVALNGITGPIEVNGEPYNGVMPAHGFLNDADLATILTYIRQHFGNQSSSVSAEEVKNARKQNTH